MTILGKKPPETWPLNGNIQFNDMSLRYIEADQPVLKNITCSIRANEKVFCKKRAQNLPRKKKKLFCIFI
jgi:ABC-type bacteriocin/lantibiotic exporter with double-glycine peptidase domain